MTLDACVRAPFACGSETRIEASLFSLDIGKTLVAGSWITVDKTEVS